MKVELIPIIFLSKEMIQFKNPDIYHSIIPNYYRINQFQDIEDLHAITWGIVSYHYEEKILPYPIEENYISSFMGGYLLKINNDTVYGTQCCSNLADINGWSTLLDKSFSNMKLPVKGHPSPFIEKTNDYFYFKFEDKNESFKEPAVDSKIEINLLEKAIVECEKEVMDFISRLNKLNEIYDVHPESERLRYLD